MQHAVQNMKQLHQEELHKLNTSVAAKQSEIETANSRLGQLSSEIEVAKSANSDLKTNMERLKASHKEEQMKVESLTKELHHSKDTVKKVTSDLDSAKERFEAFKGHARSCHFHNLFSFVHSNNIKLQNLIDEGLEIKPTRLMMPLNCKKVKEEN